MSFWDLLLGWFLLNMTGGKVQPKWPGPGVPPQPVPPQPVPPQPVPPVPVPPVPVPPVPVPPTPDVPPTPMSAWKPYWYSQPDAGAAYGTPYGLAQAWVGSGGRWTDLYNYTKGRPIGATKGHGDQWVDPRAKLHGETSTDYPADVGDKLLVPNIWPDPPNATIQSRCSTIPDGTPLPGVTYSSAKVHGDDDVNTI